MLSVRLTGERPCKRRLIRFPFSCAPIFLQHNCGDMNYDPLTEQEKQQLRTHVVKYLDGEVNDLQVSIVSHLHQMKHR